MFRCPVCAYPNLKSPPQDDLICPCCGTQFGYDDFTLSHTELRMRWIANGYPWFSSATPPAGWNAVAQLEAADLYPRTVYSRQAAATQR